MKEHIYTIPINEAFENHESCPLCRLKKTLEKNEIERITGASMMEPSVRVKTNEQGFCFKHFEMIANNGKRHPVALILQSHLEEISATLQKKKGAALAKYIEELDRDCYVCRRLDASFFAVCENLVWLYENDESFADKLRKSKLCFSHAAEILTVAEKEMPKKRFPVLCDDISAILKSETAAIREDIDWFCKKFDYRYKEESWKNSKDSIERAVELLTGNLPQKGENT